MELLNGIAAARFEKWMEENYEHILNGIGATIFSFPPPVLNTFITEWLSSVGIEIGKEKITKGYWLETSEDYSDTENNYISLEGLESIEVAISKSTQIYNLKHSHELFS